MQMRTIFSHVLLAMATVSLATPALAEVDAKAAKALFQQKGCVGCHAVDQKVFGPAYKVVAAKHKGEANAIENVAARIQSGGTGLYGTNTMPPQSSLTSKELRILAEWVLAGAPDESSPAPTSSYRY